MSRLRLLPTGMTVPDKFRFICPIDGHLIEGHMDTFNWFKAIRKHYADNGYPIPDDIESIAEDQLCQMLGGEWCRYEDGTKPERFLSRRVNLENILAGTRVFVEFVKQGRPLVSQEEANRRALICSRCYALDTVSGCGSCTGLTQVVSLVLGAKATAYDNALEGKSCLACKCAAKANVWVPVEVSKVGVTPEAAELFKSIPHCWKAQELQAIDQGSQPDMNETHD